jgi:hypothetical protein
LAALLAAVDRGPLGADALLDLVAARARLLWHVQGELLADLAQVVTAESTTGEVLGPEQDRDEVRVSDGVGQLVGWTLRWTTGYAQGQVADASALATRLPMVLAAVREGLIDQAKAAAFADALSSVDDEVAVRTAVRLLPKARTWTLTQLRERLRYHVDRADPAAARRRYRKRVAQRDVYLQAQPDGTANLSGQGLPPHRAAAAYRSPHCRVTAARCELDHRIEYAKGGPSHRGAVDCRCRRHHHPRHRKGYQVTKTGRTTTWTIPSGRIFTVTADKDLIPVTEDRW